VPTAAHTSVFRVSARRFAMSTLSRSLYLRSLSCAQEHTRKTQSSGGPWSRTGGVTRPSLTPWKRHVPSSRCWARAGGLHGLGTTRCSPHGRPVSKTVKNTHTPIETHGRPVSKTVKNTHTHTNSNTRRPVENTQTHTQIAAPKLMGNRQCWAIRGRALRVHMVALPHKPPCK
jgi:hypothetical protein